MIEQRIIKSGWKLDAANLGSQGLPLAKRDLWWRKATIYDANPQYDVHGIIVIAETPEAALEIDEKAEATRRERSR